MWVRSAFWVGRPKQGEDDAFVQGVNNIIVPGLKTLPGVLDAEAFWPRRLEDSPPDVCCQIIVRFESVSDIDRMLASPERAAMRERVLAVTQHFEGAFSHIDYEVGQA